MIAFNGFNAFQITQEMEHGGYVRHLCVGLHQLNFYCLCGCLFKLDREYLEGEIPQRTDLCCLGINQVMRCESLIRPPKPPENDKPDHSAGG